MMMDETTVLTIADFRVASTALIAKFEREQQEERVRLLGACLPIRRRSSVPTAGLDDAPLPVVQVSTRHRPDVANLVRVLRQEQMPGRASISWESSWVAPAWRALDVVVWSPARCHFRLAFHRRRDAALLDLIQAPRSLGQVLLIGVPDAASAKGVVPALGLLLGRDVVAAGDLFSSGWAV